MYCVRFAGMKVKLKLRDPKRKKSVWVRERERDREGLVPKALYQKMLVLEEMSHFS